jgi:hypothetical protein
MSHSTNAILDWNHKEIQICRSNGGVIATTHPMDNLIRPEHIIWPPPEIIQKLYKSRQERAFERPDDRKRATSGLGFYCDLQSLHSEDAITWSVFGTLRYAPREEREKWAKNFFEIIGLCKAVPDNPEISLWRRTPHPDNLSPGGPEIDFLISTSNAIVLGEAKWLSGIGAKQGKTKDNDQIQIRQKLLKEYGHIFFPGKAIQAIVVVSLFVTSKKADLVFPATWEKICKLVSHPNTAEVLRYFIWKKEHTQSDTVR